jgi:hypothetical protein
MLIVLVEPSLLLLLLVNPVQMENTYNLVFVLLFSTLMLIVDKVDYPTLCLAVAVVMKDITLEQTGYAR